MSDFLTFDELIAIHDKLIEEFGGAYGIIDVEALKSALKRPQIGYYRNLIEEAAALMESLAMNHPFVDGNKRMAFFATDTFLRLNGYYIECDNEEAYAFIMNLFESNAFQFDYLVKWLKDKVKIL